MLYAVLYAVLAGAALGVFHWATGRYVDAQLEEGLKSDFYMLLERYDRDGITGLMELLDSRSASAEEEGRYYLLVDSQGAPLAGNLLGLPPEDPLPLDGEPHVAWVEDDIIPDHRYHDDAYWPLIGSRLSDGSTLVVARSVRQAEALQSYSLYALLALLGVIVLLALTMGLLMGRGILRRIDRITDTASHIMAGELQRRIPVSERGDEFDALSSRLNQMLDRIEQLLRSMREVTDNVAHDLRGPINRIRNRLEVTLLEPRDEAEYRETMEQTIKDADTLIKTFNAILQTAQADAGTIRAEVAPMDLAGLVEEIAELYGPAVEEACLTLRLETGPPLSVLANRDLLTQAIGNLLDNAIKYTPTGGAIVLEVVEGEDTIDIVVEDTGPGIPTKDRERVKQRFVRLDGARRTQGNGLGLSLVDAIARQHGACLILEDNDPGLRAILRFKRSSPT